jgi:hypothetical protein
MARLTFVVLLLSASLAAAQPLPPELTAPVNDFAGVIDPQSAAEIETLIRRLQDASGDVIVVATVRTFKPYADLQSYAVQMFENHGKGIGTRKGDNGALSSRGTTAVRIEVAWPEGLSPTVRGRPAAPPWCLSGGEYGPGPAGVTRVAQRIAAGRKCHYRGGAAGRCRAARPTSRSTITILISSLHPLPPGEQRSANVR